jgi:hypothetical protein
MNCLFKAWSINQGAVRHTQQTLEAYLTLRSGARRDLPSGQRCWQGFVKQAAMLVGVGSSEQEHYQSFAECQTIVSNPSSLMADGSQLRMCIRGVT